MPTGVGFGLASGDAILGNVGSPHYMNYTIIGDAVNVAARLVELAQPGELLVAGPALEAAGQRAAPRGRLPLRGRSEPVDVYSAML
ncbi:MAG: adenylate/guanylate cyclase domain-containing protein [Betaproteobacteria bacterium]|nr:MAG: adenylate/guanylate cyclase domain-containing protein [Betaproteobacteria bacterium]